MAAQPGSAASALPAAAHVVGNAFVNQYYNVLHQSPQVVHRFYTDASRLTRAEAGADGAVDTVVTQAEIHNKVMSLDYGDFKAEIKTVDSQDSLTGGVLVMVTGSLSSKSNGKRNFVQSFFLAPQEKGYFVLNDVFRYLDEEPQLVKPAPNGIPEPPTAVYAAPEPAVEPPMDAEREVREIAASPPSEGDAIVEEIYDPPEGVERVEVSEVEEDEPVEDVEQLEVSSPVIDEPVSPLVENAPSLPSLEDAPGDLPKKSYASILRLMNSGGTPAAIYSVVPKQIQAVTDRPAITVHSLPPLSATPPATPLKNLDENAPAEIEADGRSVYIKNLPVSITSSQLEEEFVRFGPIKAGGVNVKSQKQQNVCYAFVEFEDSSAAQSAIEASPVPIGGRPAYVEEKRTMGLRAGRGRPHEGRGDRGDRPYRNEGLRGRGSFGGRGLGRGPGQDRDREMPNRGRGSGPPRGGFAGANNVGVASNSGVDSNRRPDGQGGSGPRPPRRGAGNQLPRNGSGSLPRNGTPAATQAATAAV